MLKLCEWARKSIIALNVYYLILQIIVLFLEAKIDILSDLLSSFWYVLIIFFFTRPKVKEQFNQV